MNDEQPGGNPWLKNLLIWGGIFMALLLVVSTVQPARRHGRRRRCPIPISAPRWPKARSNRSRSARTGSPASSRTAMPSPPCRSPATISLPELLQNNGVKFSGEAPGRRQRAAVYPGPGAAVPADPGRGVLRAAPDAEGRRRRGDGLWQIEGQAADRTAGPRDLSTTSPGSMKRARSWRKSSNSCKIRSAFPSSAGRSPRARCWSARPAPARPCWPARSRARRACRSSPFRVRTSSKCSSASAPAACATCSNRPRRTRRASSSSTKSTRSAAIAAMASAIRTTSASRRSTSCWSKWTGSRPTRASSSSPRPTAPTCSIPRCCARAGSIARSWCRSPISKAARRSSACT